MVISRHHGLLGTTVDLHVTSSRRLAAVVERAVLTEIARLAAIFDVFEPTSELSRFRSDPHAEAGPELRDVLEQFEQWRARSDGALNPATDRLRQIWRDAQDRRELPDRDALERAAAAINAEERPRHDLNLNAIAKGWIVDRAVEAGRSAAETRSVWLSAGGDVRHEGDAPIRVGIEDPARPHDNVEPLAVVAVMNQAIATSGSARRTWQIAGQHFSHVIDPRSGWPVDHIASASVIAPDAATADALATAVTVAPVEQGLALIDATDGASCLMVAAGGEIVTTSRWPAA